MKIYELLIDGTITSITMLYMSKKLIDSKNIKKYWYYLLSFVILCGYFVLSYPVTMVFVRYVMFLEVLFLCFNIIYNIESIKLWLLAFFCWILLLLSEFFICMIVAEIFKVEVMNFAGNITLNIIICLISYSISRIKYVNRYIQNIINKDYGNNIKYNVFLINLLACSFSILLYINYIKLSSIITLSFSLIIIFIYTIITLKMIDMRRKSEIIKSEYDNLNKNLLEYEQMLDIQKVSNHENKNQLLVIRGMIDKREKTERINDYINSLIENNIKDNEELLFKTNRIPSGGLRGLVYYKLLLMKDKNINIEFSIDSLVRKINFDKIDLNLNKDFCKIIGVMLDNAIEAVDNLQNKNISINMNVENNLFKITISNNFEGDIDFSSMENKGYTTKGSGHGYGLALVKDIVQKYDEITNKKFITKNIFKQEVSIKI